MDRSLLVVVDEANVSGMFRKYGRRLEWLQLRQYIIDQFPNYSLSDFKVFVGLPPDSNEFIMFRSGKQNFLKFLDAAYFTVYVREGMIINRYNGKEISYRADVDVMLTVETLLHVHKYEPEHIVLVTGDNDFVYLVEALIKLGHKVTVCGLTDRIGKALNEAASGVLTLDIFAMQLASLEYTWNPRNYA